MKALTAKPNSTFITTAKCPDGVYFGALWKANGELIAMSENMPSRYHARKWAISKKENA